MAEWAGLKVTERWAPNLAQARRAKRRRTLEASPGPLKLASWGGVTVKREAFLRQVTPEVRARMEADPRYMPPGPFSFGPGDMISDESNTLARYAGSLALFEALEQKAGAERMQAWFRAVWQADGKLDTGRLTVLAREYTGVDLKPLLER